jgi:hypothetical protein
MISVVGKWCSGGEGMGSLGALGVNVNVSFVFSSPLPPRALRNVRMMGHVQTEGLCFYGMDFQQLLY